MTNHQRQSSQGEARTSEQKNDQILEFMLAPALTLMVFLRKGLGMRLLSPARIVRTTLVLLAYALVLLPLLGGRQVDVAILSSFACVFAVASTTQYVSASKDAKKGVLRHSLSPGISRIEERGFFPAWFRNQRRVHRLIEPVFCLVAACFLLVASPSLSVWLCLSAFCLKSLEDARYRASIDRSLDVGDSLIEGEIMQEEVAHYSGRRATSRTTSAVPGLPTGLAGDTQKHIANRKAMK